MTKIFATYIILIKIRIKILFFFILFCVFHSYSQKGYPEPPKNSQHLFYIQHSNNHNTYIYDANVIGNKIDTVQPIKAYRKVYTKSGKIQPLSLIQKKFAYGIIIEESKTNLFKFRLAASKKLFFFLSNSDTITAKVYVTVNNHKIYLDKIYVKLKDKSSGLHAKAEYILFYGKDFNSGETVIEKVIPL